MHLMPTFDIRQYVLNISTKKLFKKITFDFDML